MIPPMIITTDELQIVIGYWDDTIHVGVWIAIILVTIIALNSFFVGGYGEAEFIFASTFPNRLSRRERAGSELTIRSPGFKIITIIGLLILALILDLGGGP